MLDSATDLEINPNFERIEIGPPLPNLTDEVIRELSTDQSYGYRIVSAIRSGTVPKDLALLQIGPVCHSRWLTTALRFMRIWISIHNIRGKTLKNLKMIVEFCVGVYMVNWFNIKIHSNWSQGPNHQLFLLQLLKQQSVCVLNLVLPTVQRSAWYCHSEAVLQAMLCSKDKEERKQAVKIITAVRGKGDGDKQLGDMSVRPRKTPKINTNASCLKELIPWNEDIHEPPLTCHLTTNEIKQYIEMPMQVPDWPSHTQSVERCVKMTTEAAGHVFSQQRRDVYIRGQMVSRGLMSTNKSKKDLFDLLNFSNV